jgi:type IV pilus assembly protein PilY1
VSNATGQASCTAAALGTVTTNNTVWGTGTTCSYDATPSTTLTNQSSCTWVVPATAASLPRTDCVYNGAAATTLTNQGTCNAVAQSTGNSNGTVWTGPAVACAYQAAVLSGTNLTACSAGTPSAGPNFVAYTTCGYINGTTVTGLNACARVADSTGPNYVGPANACAYATTPSVANVGTCSTVAQDLTNFSAPQKACAYETVGTSATNLASCAAQAQSGTSPYVGPNVTCAYSGTATLSYPGSCTVNVEAGPSYTAGAKVGCAYAAGVVSNNVGACSVQAKQTLTTNGSAYAPAIDCAYGTTTAWANATAACVPVAQSGGSPYAGPARNCQYTAWTANTYAGTCAALAQDNTNLTARNCVASPFAVTISTVATTVDSCSTAPTSGVSPVDPAATRSTATTCTYLGPTAASDAATCTPHAQDVASPYTTAVTCPVSDTGYLPVAPSCTATVPPATFDGTGKIVECRTTDTSPYNVTYPSGPVPVATCTPGTDAVSKVQTTCTPMLATGPTPVDPTTCVSSAAVAPSYVTTTCIASTATSTVTGCSAPSATAPLWQTVTCTDNGDGSSDTLADVASYYYWTDLRNATLGNCTGSIVPPATAGNTLCSAADDALPLVAAVPGGPVSAYNNVPVTAADPNKRQHMTTFTLGLGASGYMKFSDTYLSDINGDYATVYGVAPHAAINGIAADPANGVCSWQSTGNCNWPFPASDEQTTIDDLWHAGVNGHGAYFSATEPDSLSASISAALNTVAAAGGSSAAPALSNPSLTPGDNYLFGVSYTSLDWTGELIRRQLDPYTGAVAPTDDWAAQAKLDAKAPATRNIYVFDSSVTGTHLKAFTSANFATDSNFLTPHISTSPTGLTQYLCASPLVCLSAAEQASASGANLINFLRGDRTYEDTPSAPPPPKYYRLRQHVLGDMVNAQAVYVNKPFYNYSDPGYGAFVTSVASRQAAVYAGANDGMLHIFAAKGTAATETAVAASAAATSAAHLDPSNALLASAAASAAATAAAAVASDTTIGQELWAYIPSMVMPNLYQLADMDYKNKHRYYVDATPVVGDVCISNCTAAGAVWKTILVGGLGRGGRGYYALDITDPATPKALWEFTDANLGYSYGNPLITKVCDDASCATKTWAVLVTSGYNNIPNDDGATGDGVGRLFVINAATGALIRTLSTGAGTATDPSGLARISGYVNNPQSDNTVEAVYGGDLNGNLWRFDVNATLGAAGYEAQLLAVLKDAGNNLQPITTAPELAQMPSSHIKVVYVGTGRFLAGADASDTSQQSIYAIKDDRAAGTTPATPIFDNPGGDRSSVLSTAGFVRQVHSIGPCPTGTPTYVCLPGQDVLLTTANAVDFSVNNGWFVDLINASERANTDPALVPGLLVFNTNAPSLLACDVGGKGYQYWFDYKSGASLSVTGTTGIIGLKLGDMLYSSPTIISAGGQLKVLSGCSGPNCYDVRQPGNPQEVLVPRRTAWREWIRE